MNSDIEDIHTKALIKGKGRSSFYTDLQKNESLEITKATKGKKLTSVQFENLLIKKMKEMNAGFK